jgi:hypothetical protein
MTTIARTAERTPNRQRPARSKSTASPRRPDGHSPAAHPRDRGRTRLELPVLGTVDLPPRDLLVYLGGLAALSVVGIIEWPVTAVIGVGHLLAAKRNNRALHDLGEAMEQA